MKLKYTLLTALFISSLASAQIKVLFDATKAEMASSADWVIDADAHNIFYSSSTHLPYVSSGSTTGASNPQRIPTPAQSGITSSTAESYWQGALSYWAIDCVKQGYTVETLPWNSQITYGNAGNVQDLSHYNVFIIDEPNSSFSATEKTAIINFVKNGGGLLIISDHSGSDRNNDGVDSPVVLNDLMSNNTVQANPFGLVYDLVDFSQTTSAVANLPGNPILHGTIGNVTQAKWTSGTSMTLDPTANAAVKGLIYKTGSSTTGNTNAMAASSTYLAGKVVAIGDSSIADDGTGDTGDTLYNGYITDAAGNHRTLLMNAVIWLSTPNLATDSFQASATNLMISPNPIEGKTLNLYYKTGGTNATFTIFDSLGRLVKSNSLEEAPETMRQTIDCSGLHSGVYFGKLADSEGSKTIKFIIAE